MGLFHSITQKMFLFCLLGLLGNKMECQAGDLPPKEDIFPAWTGRSLDRGMIDGLEHKQFRFFDNWSFSSGGWGRGLSKATLLDRDTELGEDVLSSLEEKLSNVTVQYLSSTGVSGSAEQAFDPPISRAQAILVVLEELEESFKLVTGVKVTPGVTHCTIEMAGHVGKEVDVDEDRFICGGACIGAAATIAVALPWSSWFGRSALVLPEDGPAPPINRVDEDVLSSMDETLDSISVTYLSTVGTSGTVDQTFDPPINRAQAVLLVLEEMEESFDLVTSAKVSPGKNGCFFEVEGLVAKGEENRFVCGGLCIGAAAVGLSGFLPWGKWFG